MSPYLDVIVIPVPRAKLDTYKTMSAGWGKAHVRHGAMYFSDAIGDDVQPGKVTSFPQAVHLKDDETVVFSWIVYETRAERDRINEKVMSDPRLKDMMDPKTMPFDGMRMFMGGFKPVTSL